MEHSVNEIANRYSKLSEKRKDKKLFNKDDFIQFAKDNKEKYSLIENDNDLLVNTWNSSDLIDDYRKTIR